MNFRRIAANLNVDMKEWIRNKAAVFWTLAFPILLILLFGFIFTGEGETTYDLPIQDNDGGFWATNLTETLENTDLFALIMKATIWLLSFRRPRGLYQRQRCQFHTHHPGGLLGWYQPDTGCTVRRAGGQYHSEPHCKIRPCSILLCSQDGDSGYSDPGL